jgi:hypothetical protein
MQEMQAPACEQKICVGCGFCCDGTLFVHAVLKPEEKENLPEKISENIFIEGGRDYFRLPCEYFMGKCSIYDSRKADVCRSYRCQLLRDFAEHKISQDEAMTIVREAVSMRREILDLYRQFSGSNEKYFMKILNELGKYQRAGTGKEVQGMNYEILQARCNIFKVLLIKHFRSEEEFEKMIMK